MKHNGVEVFWILMYLTVFSWQSYFFFLFAVIWSKISREDVYGWMLKREDFKKGKTPFRTTLLYYQSSKSENNVNDNIDGIDLTCQRLKMPLFFVLSSFLRYRSEF